MIDIGGHIPIKTSGKRYLIIIGIIIFIYILENSFISNAIDSKIFNYIAKPALWISLSYIIYLFPKVKIKGKLKYRKSISLWAFNLAFIYIIVLVLAGLIDGFGKSPYNHSPFGILINIFFVSSILLGRELSRSYIVNSFAKNENYIIFILLAIFMTSINFSLSQFYNVTSNMGLLELIAKDVIPQFCHNLLATYLAFIGGPVPSIIYMGLIEFFEWISPVLPNLKWITKALIGIICPIFFLMSLQNIYLITAKKVKSREKEKESILSWMVTCIVSIGLIWFSVGVFPVYPSVIATGSMEPMIKPGDVIIVKKTDGDNAKKGDVIQFTRNSILISHRIIDVNNSENGITYQTKGDNNSAADFELIKPEQVKGTVVYVVPKIGWPTLLIKGKDEVHLEDIEF